MKRLMLALVAVAIALPVWAQEGPESNPVTVVENTTDRLFALIEDNRAEFEKNPDELEELVQEILLPRLDQDYSGRLVLGRHARGLEQEKIRSFAEALSGLLIERYAEQLLEFKNRDQLQVLPIKGEPDEDQTRVQTRVKLVSGQSVPVDYVMRFTDQGWQVFDVVVEGVSYVVTFRTQLNEEIQQYGFDRVMDRIKQGKIEIAGGE